MIGDLFTNEKLDSAIHDTKCQKIQFLLNERKVIEHFMVSRSPRMAKMIFPVSSIMKT